MEREQSLKFMHDLLRALVARRGSDLFITAGFPPAMKVDGKVTPVSQQSLSPIAHAGARALDHERQAGGRVRGDQGVQLRDQPLGHRALPRERLRAAGPRGPGAAHHHHHDPEVRRPGPAPRAARRGDDQARPRDLRGRHRLGQVHFARRDDRPPQREQLRAHHHDRGPGRVRARAQELHHHAARGRRGHRQLVLGAEEHAAPGARRDPDRRDPRARDDGIRHRLRRDRPPVHGHPARELDQPGAGPHHQLLPRGAPRPAADGPVAQPEGDHLPAPDPEEGRQGPRRGDRDHAQHPAHAGPHLQGRGARDEGPHDRARASWACRPSTRRSSTSSRPT